ncbi:MAG: sensor histidine kinase, partial [Kineosporiaceae bacterium]
MRRQLGIRWKVLAVLALPVLVLALAAGAVTFGALGDARLGRQVGAFAGAQDEVTKVVAALQNERLLSAAGRQPSADLRAARAVSDREIVALSSVLKQTEIASGLPATAALIDNVDRTNRRVVEERSALDRGGDLASVRAGYSAIIATDVELPGAVGEVLDDRVVARRFASSTVLGRAIEASAQVHLVGLDAVVAQKANAAQQNSLAISLTDHRRAIAQFKTGGSVVDAQVQQQASAATAAFTALATQLQRRGTGPITLTAAGWTAAAHTQADALRRLAQGVADDAAAQAESSAETTQQRAALVSGAAVALVGLMILLALMQSRQITAPLRRLAEATTRTREELPGAVEAITVRGAESAELPAVEVNSNDEVGAVAAAFRDVQHTVIEIAHDQAELRGALAETFVNVARRNQVLLARQLSFIDRLERIEEDPDALENLFRLDHLATRMRRNAESLLVLAGIDSGRRARAPMTLSDVVRTAISEVEHYERVELSSTVNPLVVAHLSLPAAHLVAELIENATQFSDPAAKVIVQTAGSGTGVQIRVIDRGLGLSAEDLADANQRVGDAEVSTLVPVHASGAQRLGLYVVARLAARLGARVSLANAPEGGTVATVELPTVVF